MAKKKTGGYVENSTFLITFLILFLLIALLIISQHKSKDRLHDIECSLDIGNNCVTPPIITSQMDVFGEYVEECAENKTIVFNRYTDNKGATIEVYYDASKYEGIIVGVVGEDSHDVGSSIRITDFEFVKSWNKTRCIKMIWVRNI